MTLATCQKTVKLVLNRKNDDAFIEGSSRTCVGYHHSKRLKKRSKRIQLNSKAPSFSDSAWKDSSRQTQGTTSIIYMRQTDNMADSGHLSSFRLDSSENIPNILAKRLNSLVQF